MKGIRIREIVMFLKGCRIHF